MLINAITTRLFCPPDKLLTGLRAKSPTTPYRPSWQRYSSSWWPVVQQIRYWSATIFFLFCFLQDRTRTPPGPLDPVDRTYTSFWFFLHQHQNLFQCFTFYRKTKGLSEAKQTFHCRQNVAENPNFFQWPMLGNRWRKNWKDFKV